MATVTISSKFQIVIPKAMREHLGLTAGQKVQVIAYDNRLELIPEQPLEKMRGFLKGIETSFEREDDQL